MALPSALSFGGTTWTRDTTYDETPGGSVTFAGYTQAGDVLAFRSDSDGTRIAKVTQDGMVDLTAALPGSGLLGLPTFGVRQGFDEFYYVATDFSRVWVNKVDLTSGAVTTVVPNGAYNFSSTYKLVVTANYLYLCNQSDNINTSNTLGRVIRFDAVTGAVDSSFSPVLRVDSGWDTSMLFVDNTGAAVFSASESVAVVVKGVTVLPAGRGADSVFKIDASGNYAGRVVADGEFQGVQGNGPGGAQSDNYLIARVGYSGAGFYNLSSVDGGVTYTSKYAFGANDTLGGAQLFFTARLNFPYFLSRFPPLGVYLVDNVDAISKVGSLSEEDPGELSLIAANNSEDVFLGINDNSGVTTVYRYVLGSSPSTSCFWTNKRNVDEDC